MTNTRKIRKALFFTLLVAALILPAGMNKRAMADNSVRTYHKPFADQPEKPCPVDEDCSLAAFKLLDWI